MTATPTLLLVHGAWHGAWAWDRLLVEPALAGFPVVAVDLPGVGRSGCGASGTGHDLTSHSAWLRERVDQLDGPLVVVSHSYGGAVVGDALVGREDVLAQIFVAAFLLDVGESCRDANPGSEDSSLGPVLDGSYLVVPEEVAGPMFYGDATPEQVQAATRRITPEHLGTVTSPVTAASWRDVSTTYVITERDQALPAVAQETMAARADHVVRLDSDHSPMLTHPTQLAEVLRGVIERDG